MRVRRWHELIKIIEENNVRSFVEIGVLKGETASNILKAFPDLEYIGIDPYVGSLDTYDHAVNKKLAQDIFDQYKNATLFIGVSEDFAVEKQYDLVFIDGDHSYQGAKADIEFWRDKCKILSGHDYSPHHKGVVKAVDENFNKVKVLKDNVWLTQITY